MRTWMTAVLLVWGAQVSLLAYFFLNLTWENYWLCRGIYRPGLRLFSMIGNGVLPGRFFSPFDRVGVMTGFAFASLIYATTAVAAYTLAQRAWTRR